MSGKQITFQTIPEYAYPAAPGKLAFFETVALLGLEERPIRMSADDQRRVLGFPVFGKQEFVVSKVGTVAVSRSTGFGQDFESCEYSASTIETATKACKKLSPGVCGRDYL